MTDIVVSYSEITSWRTCPLKHWMDYRQRQPGGKSGKAADLGTDWHACQQEWYSQGLGSKPELHGFVPYTVVPSPTSQEDAYRFSTLLWIWDGWLRAGDPFRGFRVESVEQELTVPLPRVPGQPDWLNILVKVKIDLVLSKGNKTLVVDHKTTSRFLKADSFAADMDMDDQLALYQYALEYTGYPNVSVCWNYAITTELKKSPRPLEERFWQTYSTRSAQELKAICADASYSAIDAYRRPLHEQPPRSPDKEKCRWRCSWRSECFYSRAADRPVRLLPPQRNDQLPNGIVVT